MTESEFQAAVESFVDSASFAEAVGVLAEVALARAESSSIPGGWRSLYAQLDAVAVSAEEKGV